MRPILLSIQGLNSFIDKQTIDFEALTSRGLFGIFGPTGSGKSSILDGITLALYGRIARGSTEFINKQVDVLNVVFEFSLTTQETVCYRVERELKRNKQGETRTSYAKLTQLESSGDLVLEDKAASVTKRCEDIIGLGVEDFSRTVVLPQGKFSEFLKLPNGPRREMLERIFNLEAYGASLSLKVSKALGGVKNELATLNGQLTGFEGVSFEAYEALGQAVSDLENQVKTAKQVHLELTETYTKAQRTFELQKSLEQTREALLAHLEGQAAVTTLGNQLTLAEKAEMLKPYWERLEQTASQVKDTEAVLQGINEQLTASETQLKQVSEAFEALVAQLKQEIPSKQGRLSLLKDGLKDIEQLMGEKKSLEQLKVSMDADAQRLSSQRHKQLEQEAVIKSTKEALEALEATYERQQVSEALKQTLRQLALITEKYEQSKRQSDEGEVLLSDLNHRLSNEQTQLETLTQERERCKQTLDTQVDRLNTHKADLQLKMEAKLALSLKVSEAKQRETVYQEQMAQLQKASEQLSATKIELDKASKRYELSLEQWQLLEHSWQALASSEWLSYFRQQLNDDKVCPICGESHTLASLEKIATRENVTTDESEKRATSEALEAAKVAKESAQAEKIKFTIAVETLSKQVEQLETQLKTVAIGELEDIVSAFEANEKHLAELTTEQQVMVQQIEALQVQYQGMEVTIQGLTTSRQHLMEQLNLVKVKNEQTNQDGLAYQVETETLINRLANEHDYVLEMPISEVVQVLNEQEKARELAQQTLKAKRSAYQVALEAFNQSQVTLQQLESEVASKQGSFDGRFEAYKLQKERLTEKLGTLNTVKAEHDALQAALSAFEEAYEAKSQQIKLIQAEHQEILEAQLKAQSHCNELKSSLAQATLQLDEKLKASAFETLGEAKEAVLTASEIATNKLAVETFKQKLDELNGAMQTLNQQLAGKSIDLETFEGLSSQYEASKAGLESKQDDFAKMTLQLTQMSERLNAMGELLKQRGEVEYKQAQLQDLSKLFEARKFVAFIAANQLSYVAGKASEQLLAMTQGAYSLETETDGSFMIRDYKNGGVTRDIATLSGGETFLVSLSLALALSAQIQLKGKAPLELFFLDEGFGTLDEETLEVVMSALEGLHHERLAIGLISHVEAIKNRVPIKLLVSPAKSGLGGTKVKIELS